MNIIYVWLLAGLLLLIIEVMGAPGAGLLFAGLGALIVGAALHLQLLGLADYVAQFILFFAATVLWALLLWKPLKRFRTGQNNQHYSNIIGDTAYVGSQGLTRQGGEVTWSGTIMKARLAKDSMADRLEAGAPVTIVEVAGATLTVRPKE